MRNMEPCAAELLGQLHIPINYCRLSRVSHAAKPEPQRSWAFVHRAVLGEASVFRMLNNREIDLSRSPQRVPHRGLIQDGLAIVSYRNCARALQCTQICKHCALAGLCCGTYWEDIDDSTALRLPDPRDPLR